MWTLYTDYSDVIDTFMDVSQDVYKQLWETGIPGVFDSNTNFKLNHDRGYFMTSVWDQLLVDDRLPHLAHLEYMIPSITLEGIKPTDDGRWP